MKNLEIIDKLRSISQFITTNNHEQIREKVYVLPSTTEVVVVDARIIEFMKVNTIKCDLEIIKKELISIIENNSKYDEMKKSIENRIFFHDFTEFLEIKNLKELPKKAPLH